MKNFLTLFAVSFALIVSSCSEKQKSFSIHGTVNHLSQGSKIYLDEMAYSEVTTLDTTTCNDKGEYQLKEFIQHTGLYRVRYGFDKAVFLVLDKNSGDIQIESDTTSSLVSKAVIKGSPASAQFQDFLFQITEMGNPIMQLNYQLMDTTKKLSDSTRNNLIHQIDAIEKTVRDYVVAYTDTTENPVLAVFAMSNFLIPDLDKSSFEKFLAKAKSKYTNVPMAVAFCEDVELAFKKMQRKPGESLFENGTLIPEINIPDVNGKNISLQSLKGKYVLVDFWASWCMPCRKENPNVVEAYNKYKDKGFTVYSISLDDDIEKWKKAIEQDHLSWPYHVSELKGWESEVVHQFGIEGIPTNYLIDKEGIIIASNLRGKELENILAQVIK